MQSCSSFSSGLENGPSPLLFSALSLLNVFFIVVRELPPTLEAEPEVIELVNYVVGSVFITDIRHRLRERPPAVALERRPKHLKQWLDCQLQLMNLHKGGTLAKGHQCNEGFQTLSTACRDDGQRTARLMSSKHLENLTRQLAHTRRFNICHLKAANQNSNGRCCFDLQL